MTLVDKQTNIYWLINKQPKTNKYKKDFKMSHSLKRIGKYLRVTVTKSVSYNFHTIIIDIQICMPNTFTVLSIIWRMYFAVLTADLKSPLHIPRSSLAEVSNGETWTYSLMNAMCDDACWLMSFVTLKVRKTWWSRIIWRNFVWKYTGKKPT